MHTPHPPPALFVFVLWTLDAELSVWKFMEAINENTTEEAAAVAEGTRKKRNGWNSVSASAFP